MSRMRFDFLKYSKDIFLILDLEQIENSVAGNAQGKYRRIVLMGHLKHLL